MADEMWAVKPVKIYVRGNMSIEFRKRRRNTNHNYTMDIDQHGLPSTRVHFSPAGDVLRVETLPAGEKQAT